MPGSKYFFNMESNCKNKERLMMTFMEKINPVVTEEWDFEPPDDSVILEISGVFGLSKIWTKDQIKHFFRWICFWLV